jgi:cyclin H
VEEVGKFLSQEDEMNLVFYFSVKLSEFCSKFKPPMPQYVRGTSFQYFKRFYLNNSVMDYHPKEMLITAVYLACKTEEFNVSMQQFVANISGNQERATKIILNNELLLMQELQFHLTVHNPYRAVEGLIIDIKTRWLLPHLNMQPVQEGGPRGGGGGPVQGGDRGIPGQVNGFTLIYPDVPISGCS